MKQVLFIAALVTLLLLVTGKTLNKTAATMPDENEIRDALQAIANRYGRDIAQTIERMYRIETNHFKSKQFAATGSAGMERHREKFPYGWFSMSDLWQRRPEIAPVGIWTAKEGVGLMNDTPKTKAFLKFPSVLAAMTALAEYLQKYNAGRWYAGTDRARGEAYEKTLQKIKLRYT